MLERKGKCPFLIEGKEINGYCYQLLETSQNWLQAEELCPDFAELTNQSIHYQVYDWIKTKNIYSVWIGASNIKSDGKMSNLVSIYQSENIKFVWQLL